MADSGNIRLHYKLIPGDSIEIPTGKSYQNLTSRVFFFFFFFNFMVYTKFTAMCMVNFSYNQETNNVNKIFNVTGGGEAEDPQVLLSGVWRELPVSGAAATTRAGQPRQAGHVPLQELRPGTP
jgi:hypothetical protein